MLFLSMETLACRAKLDFLRWQHDTRPFIVHCVFMLCHKKMIVSLSQLAVTFVTCEETNRLNFISDTACSLPTPNESFDNILQNIIPQWPSRCYHLVLSKQAPRLACFHSRHVHHLLMETHVREPVPQSRKVEARLKNPDQKQAFPMNFQIRVCFL